MVPPFFLSTKRQKNINKGGKDYSGSHLLVGRVGPNFRIRCVAQRANNLSKTFYLHEFLIEPLSLGYILIQKYLMKLLGKF